MTSNARELVPVLFFPVLLASGVAMHLGLGAAGSPAVVATFVPIALGAAAITVAEWRSPARTIWWPTWGDIATDTTFMALIQGLLPQLVGFALAAWLIGPLQHALPGLTEIWPSHWPLVAQLVVFLLLADLTAYWLHRAAHAVPLLWRFHGIHHSPRRLYFLNVGRFHPLEKIVQILVSTTPLIVAGAGAELLSLYFVFYALHGFLQHSNVDLRLGPLNYVFSGPELHRWHHSFRPSESDRNFGNNLIVWDIAFGTRFLPAQRRVGRLGLRDRGCGRLGFRELMAVPFAGAGARAQRWLLGLACRFLRRRARRRQRTLASAPRRAQERLLARLLAANAQSRYGREHGFGAVRSIDDFRRRVPIVDYEALRPYVDRHVAGGSRELTAAAALWYARTSGTTGEAKHVPVTRAMMDSLRRLQRDYLATAWGMVPGGFEGSILSFMGSGREGDMANGRPYGAMTGLLFETLPRSLRARTVTPPEVFEITDHDLRWRSVALLALARPDVTCMMSANPSSLVALARVVRAEGPALVEALASGDAGVLPGTEGALPAVLRALRPQPDRAREVSRALDGVEPLLAALWPRVALLATWTGGSCGMALGSLTPLLPPGIRVLDLGYAASECRGTTLVAETGEAGLPVLDDVFFEFVEQGDWDHGGRETRLVDELVEGETYQIVVTTIAGLYRYRMNDLVRVCGRYGQTPLIEFVRKGAGVTSITGEKLAEEQVIDAMSALARERDATPGFYLFVADPSTARYDVYLEAGPAGADRDDLTETIDTLLQARNIEYAAKRRSGRLGPPRIRRLRRGAGDTIRRRAVETGQRDTQFKPPVLVARDRLPVPIDDLLLVGGA